ncbi:ketol-acid reductoisomerase [Streptomyces lavenduligriseus]|uniref:Ketol-acid reductoisomerase (NADP(+)) n=1 Tax=Streptomyces lavenduligriseus TaxID=67315 RepID=A0ABT0NP69_9ACTN|nr:ketol-acid reductoisomerase [Streptomyces lavenduligriseus]MCL3992632.1 ketol-acid reductoisomerase [Streptomyces lavenduligriseus]
MLDVNEPDRAALRTRRVAVLGYGSQGRAQALNLRDSGIDVVIGLRPGSAGASRAAEDGLRVRTVAEAVAGADLVAVLVPDTAQPALYEEEIRPALAPGALLLFAHGFNVHYRRITAPEGVDVAMVAPKAPGHAVRSTYTEGRGVPCLVAVEQDATGDAWSLARAYGDAIGGGKAGLLPTTFAEETETDLFGEQAVLVGGVTGLVKTAYETLVDAGYQPESAYFECVQELKLVVDLIHDHGIAGMRTFISDTAEYGDYWTADRPVWAAVRKHMNELLADIRSGAFAAQWVSEDERGRPAFAAARAEAAAHPAEAVGSRLRKLAG